MKTADDYLIDSRIDELAYEYTTNGFAVTVRPPDMAGVDLVAEKNGRRVAYYVRTLKRLGGPTTDHAAMMEQKRRNGFTDVKVLVAAPHRQVRVEIAELDRHLLDYLQGHTPVEFAKLPGTWTVTHVAIYEYSSVRLTPDGSIVEGRGVVEAMQAPPQQKDGLSWKFPLNVAVELDASLTIRTVRQVTVETSDYEE